jgi:hypothetical protein
MEFAMAKHPDGAPVARTEAHESFRRAKEALRLAGGRPPVDQYGEPMSWSQRRGWHSNGPPPRRRGGRTLSFG